MAFKLTKEEIVTKAELHETIEKAWAMVETAVSAFNDKMNAAKEELTTTIQAFNDVAGQVAVFVSSVSERASMEIDERSEKWQEGDVGQAAATWKDEWEGFDGDGLEDIDWPGELVIEQPTVVDLDALPEEAE